MLAVKVWFSEGLSSRDFSANNKIMKQSWTYWFLIEQISPGMSGLFTALQPAEFDPAFVSGLSLKKKRKEKENKHEL